MDNWCFYASKNVKSGFEENNGIYRKFKKHFSWSSDSFSAKGREGLNRDRWNRARSLLLTDSSLAKSVGADSEVLVANGSERSGNGVFDEEDGLYETPMVTEFH